MGDDSVELKRPVRGSVEGIWWADADTVIVGVDTLSGNARFMRLSIRGGALTDVTSTLMPHWNDYDDHTWFAEGMEQHPQ